MLANILIKLDTVGRGTVEVGGVDLAQYVSKMGINMAAGQLTEVILELVPEIVEVDAPAEVRLLIESLNREES